MTTDNFLSLQSVEDLATAGRRRLIPCSLEQKWMKARKTAYNPVAKAIEWHEKSEKSRAEAGIYIGNCLVAIIVSILIVVGYSNLPLPAAEMKLASSCLKLAVAITVIAGLINLFSWRFAAIRADESFDERIELFQKDLASFVEWSGENLSTLLHYGENQLKNEVARGILVSAAAKVLTHEQLEKGWGDTYAEALQRAREDFQRKYEVLGRFSLTDPQKKYFNLARKELEKSEAEDSLT